MPDTDQPGGTAASREPDWRRLYDDAPCGLLLTDGDGTIRYVNRTFCRWIGREREELQDVARFQSLLNVGGRIFHQTHWAPLLQMQGSVGEVKLDMVRRDGSTIPMVLNAVRREADGEVTHELAVFLAEDRHTYERELMRSRKRAEELLAKQGEAQRALEDRAGFAEQMIGIVSHDLRNPLAAIVLGTGVMARARLEPPFDRTLEHMSQATRRAQLLVDDLLDFTQARIGRGLTVSPKPIDLHRVVANFVDELRGAHPGHPFDHVADGVGDCIADDHRICQMIGNLASNAVAYGAPATPVTIRTQARGGDRVVSVHNRGPAIPEDVLPGLFQPMVRGADAPAGRRSVGLGLYIVSEIAHAHRGRIEATSTESAGTTFRFTFPAA